MFQKKMVSLLVLLILIVFNLTIRIYHISPWWCSKEANVLAKQELYTEIIDGIDKGYRNLGPEQKKLLIEKQFDELLANKKIFKQKVKFKQTQKQSYHKDSDGLPYFTNLDSYHNLHLVKLILHNGFPGTNKVGTKLIDEYIAAPKGLDVPKTTFFYYLTAYSYKAFNFFIPTPLEKFCFYFPLFWLTIFLVLLYVFVSRHCSSSIALLTVFFTGLASNFLFRTLAGWYDTDIVNVLIPVVIACLLFNPNTKLKLRNVIFGCVFAFIYIYQWSFAFLFLLILLLGYLFYKFYNNNLLNMVANKYYVVVGGLISVAVLLISVSLCRGSFAQLLAMFKGTYGSFWPNTYLTVNELQNLNLSGLGRQLHGTGLLVVSLVYSVVIVLRRKKINICDSIMFCWYVVMFFASFKAMRATFYLAIPVSYFLSCFFIASIKLSLELRYIYIKRIVSALTALFLALSVVISSKNAIALTMQPFSLMNDSWNDFLTVIKEKTEKDAIINSWWDFGSFFTSISERAVTVDGNSQAGILPYWVARVLLTPDINEAMNILRMLNNTSVDLVYDINFRLDGNWERTITLLNLLLKSNREQASGILENYRVPYDRYYDPLKSKILKSIYDTPNRPVYIAIDKSMIEKMYRISFLGNWDYERAYMCKNIKYESKKKMREKCASDFNLTNVKFNKIYKAIKTDESLCSVDKLSLPVGFGERVITGIVDGDLVIFSNKYSLDLKTKKMYYRKQSNKMRVSDVYVFDGNVDISNVFMSENEVFERVNGLVNKLDIDNREIYQSGCIVYKSRSGIWSMVELSHPLLVDALISRLFFFEGKGLDALFKLVVIDADHEQALFEVKF